MESFWTGPVAVCALAVALLLVAEYRRWQALVWISKPLAAAAFIAAALDWGATETAYGGWVLLGLVLCAAGDVLLIPEGQGRAFLAGIGAFLLGHVAYVVAFASLGLNGTAGLAALVLMGGFALVVLRWLMPYVTDDFRLPVMVYVVVISLMVVMAASATFAGNAIVVLAGAAAFTISDLSVARDRFVAPGFGNRAWGLPLYFAAQLLIAFSVALVP